MRIQWEYRLIKGSYINIYASLIRRQGVLISGRSGGVHAPSYLIRSSGHFHPVIHNITLLYMPVIHEKAVEKSWIEF